MNQDKDPQGFNKMWEHFQDLTRQSDFVADVSRLRSIHWFDWDVKNIQNDPDRFAVENKPEFHEDIYTLAAKYGFEGFAWYETFRAFISENKIIKPGYHYMGMDMCMLSDVLDLELESFAPPVQKRIGEVYPILIRLSPYATQRDILDFIKKNYLSSIKPLQEHFGKKNSSMGKKRQKKDSVRERNDFIYEHQHLSRKEIMALVSKKFGESPDIGEIGKIISEERKKRG